MFTSSRWLACWLLLFSSLCQATPVELTQAQAEWVAGTTVTQRSITLPFAWDNEVRSPGGGDAHFKLNWTPPILPSEPAALYLPKVGNRFQVWLNGELLLQRGDMQSSNREDYGRQSQIVLVPASLLRPNNLVEIQIRADFGRRAGLSPVWAGRYDELLPIVERAYRLQVLVPFVVLFFSLSVSVLALGLWLTQARSQGNDGARPDNIYLLACITEFCWGLRMMDYLMVDPIVPWPWWGAVSSTAFMLWIFGAFAFAHGVAQHSSPISRRTLGWILASGVLCAFAPSLGMPPLVWTVWLGALSVGLLLYGSRFLVRILRQPSTERLLIAFAAAANILAGAHDWAAVRVVGDASGAGPWIRYTSVLFGWTLALIVINRFRRANQAAGDLTRTLQTRIAAKEVELLHSFRQQEQLQLEQARSTERNRVVRDMHDGVGSHLGTAIRQLESGQASLTDVIQTLRESLDQLKLSVDSMGCDPGDLSGLLASLRYRLEPRLKSCGIDLIWCVDAALPNIPTLDLPAMQHLRYMLFEVFSNVMQHASATTLQLHAGVAQETLTLRLQDNGVGFNSQSSQRRGLRFLSERASQIGATVSIISQPGATSVAIELPVSPPV